MIKTILIGQIHEDPAAFVAAHHIIKKCVDNGVKLVCGYEDDRALAELIPFIEGDVCSREQIFAALDEEEKNAIPAIMPRRSGQNYTITDILGNTSGRPEQLALLHYLQMNAIEVVPLEEKGGPERRQEQRAELLTLSFG